MRINLNNKRYMIVSIDKYMNKIMISIFDENNNNEQVRSINEVEFIDLYNLFVYAQEQNKDISRLWGLNNE